MIKKYQKGGPKLTFPEVNRIPYTVTVADINSSAGANVKPLTPLQAYDLKRNTERRKLEAKRNEAIAISDKKTSANKILKNGSVMSALLGQDHSGAKPSPIMIGNYNLANNPVMRVANGVVQSWAGNQPSVSALNNNDSYSIRQILDAGATNVEGAYNTGNGVVDFLNPLNIGNSVIQSWASAPLEAQENNSYLPYLKAAGNTYLAAGLPGTGKLLRYAAPEMMNTVDAAKRLYGRKLSKSYNNFTTNTGEVIDNLGNRYLPNAYKLNPYSFQKNLPKDVMFRGIGEEGLEDALKSNMLKSPNPSKSDIYWTNKFNTADNFADPVIYKETGHIDTDGFPLTTSNKSKKVITTYPISEPVFSDRYAGSLEHLNKVIQKSEALPIDKAKFYKEHWWKGYKQIEIPKQLPGSTNSFGEIPTNLSAINLVKESSKPKSKMYKSSEIIKDSNFDIKKIFRGDKENPKQIKITGKSGKWTVNRSKDGSYYFNAGMSNPLESGKAMLKINELLPPKPTILEPNSFSLDSYLNTLKLGKRPDWEAKFENYIPLNHSAIHNKTLSNKFGFEPEGTYVPFSSLEDANIALKDVNAMLKKQGINYEADVIANGNGWYGISIPNFKLTRNHKEGGMVNDNNGYLTSNLHNFTPKKIIKSNHITTQGMAFPIKANGVPLYPNTGDYIFPTNRVVELPMFQGGGPILNNRSMLFNQMPNPTFLPLDRSRKYYLDNKRKRVSETKIGIGDERGEWVIPTTINGVQLSEKDAVDHFYQTGEHMGGPYETIDESNKSAESRTRAYNGLSALEDYKNGGIPDRYKKQGFTRVGQEKDSTRPGKKWMVLAKKGDSYKVVHGGDSSMQDYTQHHDNQRKKNFWNRMGHTSDKFSPRYWHQRLGKWEEGGIVDTYKQGGINIMHNGQPMYRTLDGRIVKRGLWSNTYLSNKK